MWTTVALAAALSLAPGQSGQLALTNVRNTYGVLGPPRADTKFLPGDDFVLSFDIEGIQVDGSGKALYSIALEVTDGQGNVQFKQAPRDLEANNSLGGSSLPAFASLKIGLDHPPGTYTVKVTVTDRAAKATQTLTRSYQVLPKGFGLVRLTTSADPEGAVPTPFFGKGQSLWANFAVVGFERDKAKGQPHLAAILRVLDDQGHPTVDRPFAGEVAQEVPAQMLALPLQFMLQLNRAGKFTVELSATDKINGQTAALSFPLTVLGQKP